MTHVTVKTLLAQKADEVGNAKDKNQTDSTLREFGKCAVALRDVLYDVLYQDRSLTEEEFLFIDNHFLVLQLAYLRWKRKHIWPEDPR